MDSNAANKKFTWRKKWIAILEHPVIFIQKNNLLINEMVKTYLLIKKIFKKQH